MLISLSRCVTVSGHIAQTGQIALGVQSGAIRPEQAKWRDNLKIPEPEPWAC